MLTRIYMILLGCALSMPAIIVWAGPPDGLYLDGGKSSVGVILVHGRGVGPSGVVVNPLRIAIHERLGYHTISLSYPMSKSHKSAQEELKYFPDAYERIDAAISFLTKEKGVTRLYIIGHSLGTRITTSYLVNKLTPIIGGYIGIGVMGGMKKNCQKENAIPLSSWCNLKATLANNPVFPIMDVVALGDEEEASLAEERAAFISPTYQQIRIEGADHQFLSKGDEMVNRVVLWLKGQQPQQ
jgi:hypothetical protein